ncbi:DUF5694 domain-containing protein [Alkalicoccobacillus gibsonii]|uniref:DUF5694 domain-containing protein n=1 Tax=Alkalicoccobacillus gibsonii TaxID=79881 RepID=UPI001932337A|nr:DUF5694 domain-containing protein [Alkalicoccobacillus gibsonii]MBM0066814.1 hypothetical protein [Alkalicoccobacillus gibsonii]
MKPKVLVLGSYHLNEVNSIGMDAEDGKILVPDREKELMELLQKMEAFQPTKVAVEVEVKRQEEIDREYQTYLSGNWKLPLNEIHQVGFRLAKSMNHQHVFAVDWMGSVPEQKSLGDILDWAEAHQPELSRMMKEQIESINKQFTFFDDRSLVENYCHINHPASIKKSHEIYMHVARIGEWNNYVGMDWLRWWYQRNLILYANLTRLIDSNDDRIFLVIGSSHLHTVNQFLKESGLFQVEDAYEYLTD